MEKNTTKRGNNHGFILPVHAYHPNVALRSQKPKGYIAWPEK